LVAGCIFLSACRGEHTENTPGREEEINPEPVAAGGEPFDSSC